MKFSHQWADCNGTGLHYVTAGPASARHTLVFLHGFPEYWGTWQRLMGDLADAYRVIAPDLPGYNRSDKPSDPASYRVPALVETLASFLRQVGDGQPVTLVAHDWGGAIAWPLAAFHPDLLDRLIILNAAHPSTFTREMIQNPRQRRSSGYIHDLIASDGPERLARDDFAYLRVLLFEGMAMPDLLDSERQAAYREAWSQPGALDGMLAYYRAMPQLAPPTDATADKSPGPGPIRDPGSMRVPEIRINVPTLVLWGERDWAFVPEVLDGLADYVADCRVKRFPDATHWLHHEKHSAVLDQIRAFVGN